MDFAGLGRAGMSEALALFSLEMASFGCGGDDTHLVVSLSGSPLPPPPLLIFCGAFAAAHSLPRARATGTVLNRRLKRGHARPD